MDLKAYEPGVIGITDCRKEDYFADPGFSRSEIVAFLNNPAESQKEVGDTLPMRIGTIHDAYVTDPVGSLQIVGFPGTRAKKGYKESGCIYTKSEVDEGFALAELTKNSHFYKEYVEDKGEFQVAVFFEIDEIRCKALIDHASPPMLLDFKSIRDCTNQSIKSAIYDYGLDLQASFYTLGFCQYVPIERFVIHFTGKTDGQVRIIEFEDNELFGDEYFVPILQSMEMARTWCEYRSIYSDMPESFAMDTSNYRNNQREKVCELYEVQV